MNRSLKKGSKIYVAVFFLFLFLNGPLPAQEDKRPGLDFRTVISQVAKASLPAVVHVKAFRHSETRTDPVPPLDEFFNDLPFPLPFNSKMKSTGMQTGSGLIIHEQGYILTNQHLVLGAKQIQVALSNNKHYDAALVGTDPRLELAVLRIQDNIPFPRLRFGNSDLLEQGEWVIALGHGQDQEQTVSQGVICTVHRKIVRASLAAKNFIQTDALINAGNCGGPLLNLKGEVIGLNLLTVSRPGPLQGVGLALPANVVQPAVKQIIAGNKIERSWLGVQMTDLSPEQARDLDLPSTKGVLITDLFKNGPAEQGGFKKGDVVISFQEKEILSGSQLQEAVNNVAAGQEVKIGIIRKGVRQTLRVTLGRQEQAIEQDLANIKLHLGAELRVLTNQEPVAAGHRQGLVVVWIDPEGPLHEIGLEQGDVILQANGRTVQNRDDLTQFAHSLVSGQIITLLALDHRSGRSGYVQVVLR